MIFECFGVWDLCNFIFSCSEADSSEDETSELDTNIDDVIEFIGDTLPALFTKMQVFTSR